MSGNHSPMSGRKHGDFLHRLLWATAAGGTLDLIYACVVSYFKGRMPMTVLQSVASGWQGTSAYQGGWTSALLGLSTHYAILAVMAGVFGLGAMRMASLRQRPWIAGPLYGIGLYAVMYGIVLPLRFPAVFPRLNGWTTVSDIFVHMGVGLIIALIFSASARVKS